MDKKERLNSYIPTLNNLSELLTKVMYCQKRRNLVILLLCDIYDHEQDNWNWLLFSGFLELTTCSQADSYGIKNWGDCRNCAMNYTISGLEHKYWYQNVSIIKFHLQTCMRHVLRGNSWRDMYSNKPLGLFQGNLSWPHNTSKIINTITTSKIRIVAGWFDKVTKTVHG